MASTIENITAKVDALTSKVDALAAKDASRKQELAARSTAFEERLAELEFQHRFAQTSQMMGKMDF
jgi:outer membrane murein-binding lipoprotein Lpp